MVIGFCTSLSRPIYRASQKTWYRPWFVHSWLFSIRYFIIKINILNEHSFSSNVPFVSTKLIVSFRRYDLFSKNPWNSIFSKKWQFYASRYRVVVLHFLFFLECLHELFANRVLFPINPITISKQKVLNR